MIAEIATLAEEVLPVVVEALTKGVTKMALIKAIEDLMTEASDAEMTREFPMAKK